MQLAADPQGEFEVPLPPERAAAVREQVPYSKPRYTYTMPLLTMAGASRAGRAMAVLSLSTEHSTH